MDDQELNQLRAQRLAQLQASSKGGLGSNHSELSYSPTTTTSSGSNNAADQAQAAAEEEARKAMLIAILDNEARERLARIQIVKPANARHVEDLILRLAKSGQFRGKKISEQDLIQLLGNISDAKQETKVIFNRRRDFDDDLDD